MEVGSQASVQNGNIQRVSNSGKPSPPKNLLQVMLVEKYRLDYLHKSRCIKRPSQSLRVSGCKAHLKDDEILPLLSEVDSKALAIAIKKKQKDIDRLYKDISNTSVPLVSLPRKEKKKWVKHFQDKIIFYKSLENTRWKNWPKKSENPTNKNRTTSKNKSKKLNKKYNKIKRKAKTIVDNKQVRILVDIEVPAEAISVLGKGLGFVPTPQMDIEELRLDGRRLCNTIAKLDKDKNTDNDVPIMNNNDIPFKLKPINYSPPPDKINNPIISQAINIFTTKLNAQTTTKVKQCNKNNLSHHELQGLKWLKEKTSNSEIVITQADKGGSILIIPQH